MNVIHATQGIELLDLNKHICPFTNNSPIERNICGRKEKVVIKKTVLLQ